MKKIIFPFLLLTLFYPAFAQKTDTTLLLQHLKALVETEKPRNYQNPEILNSVANHIHEVFSNYADTVYFQPYSIKGKEYKNVVGIFGWGNKKTIVVGAHYDVCGDQPGADDNASGVAGLLELARLLHQQPLNYRIELVAYTLEEPPYFRSQQMGSYIHAKSLAENKVDVFGMVCLEMIGYFNDIKNSQDYPLGLLSLFYGNKGDYITLVSKFGKGKFARQFSRKFKGLKSIKTKKLTAPALLEGVDFSDHLNYWNFGISALMITDTAFYRNKNYHEKSDTLDTLDLKRMGEVIQSVYDTLTAL